MAAIDWNNADCMIGVPLGWIEPDAAERDRLARELDARDLPPAPVRLDRPTVAVCVVCGEEKRERWDSFYLEPVCSGCRFILFLAVGNFATTPGATS